MPEKNVLDNRIAKIITMVLTAVLAIALLLQMMTPSANAGTANGVRADTIPTRTLEPQQYVPVILNEN